MDTLDGDEHGDINEFWRDRDHNKDAAKVKAVRVRRPRLPGRQRPHGPASACWWNALEGQQRAARSCGCCARATPIRSSSAAPSGSTRCTAGSTRSCRASTTASVPSRRVTIEDEPDVWKNYTSWPIPGTQNTDVYLRGGSSHAGAGTLGGVAGGGTADTLTFQNTGANVSEATLHRHARGPADEPPRVPLADADQGRPPLRHRRPEPARRARHHAEQPVRGHRRLSAPTTQISRTRRRRPAEHHDAHLLGRDEHRQQRVPDARAPVHHDGHRRRQRLLPRGRPSASARSPSGASRAARWTRRQRNSFWYADASPVVAGRVQHVQHPAAADGAHLQGRQQDRDHRHREPVRRGRLGTVGSAYIPSAISAAQPITIDTRVEQDHAPARRRRADAGRLGRVHRPAGHRRRHRAGDARR